MKDYKKIVVEVVKFEVNDIITASNPDTNETPDRT